MAEKGEHERTPKAGESCPTPLRATLRAPSSKWAIEAFFRRVSAANCPEGKRGPSGALGAAQNDPQGGLEASRATGRELCDTGHPVLEDSPEGATAGRSPRRAATWAVFVVAVPLAFFGTFFRFERKYVPLQGGSPTVRAVVGASIPRSRFPSGKVGAH